MVAFSFVQGYLKHRENCEHDVGNSVTFKQPSGGHSCQSLLAVGCTHTYICTISSYHRANWMGSERISGKCGDTATLSACYL